MTTDPSAANNPRYDQTSQSGDYFDKTGYGQGQAPYAGSPQTPYGQQPGNPQPVSGGYPGPGPLTPNDERTWATVAHAAGPVAALFSAGTLGWAVPLVIFLLYKDRSHFVRNQAAEALNFQITLAIAYVAILVITLFTFGIGAILFFVPWVLSVVFGILAAVAVSRGESYRYPMTLRLVH